MSQLLRATYLLAACGLHAVVLWGMAFGPPPMIGDDAEEAGAVEVGLVEIADPAPEAAPEQPSAEPLPPEPPPPVAPEPPPTLPPPEPEPVAETAPPPPVPAEAIPEPAVQPAPPKPKPPAPRPPKPRAAARPAASALQASASPGATAGSATAGTGRIGPGDQGHAVFRNRVAPIYPPSARTAKSSGRVLVTINVNALGQPVSARIYASSGNTALDQAALYAARASSFRPRRLAGIPLPDEVTVPYKFRVEE